MNRPRKNQYKVVDANGRIYLPADLRQSAGIRPGDIVKLDGNGNRILVQPVCLVELGDKSQEAAMEYSRAVYFSLSPKDRAAFLALILGEKEESGMSL